MIALLLSGCAILPSWFTYTLYGMDGISYLTTSKSPTDHAVSLVLDEDCALWRFVKGQKVCREKVD